MIYVCFFVVTIEIPTYSTLYDIIVTTLPYRQIPPYLTLFYDKVLGFSYQHIGWDMAAECIYAAVWWVRVCRRRRRNAWVLCFG